MKTLNLEFGANQGTLFLVRSVSFTFAEVEQRPSQSSQPPSSSFQPAHPLFARLNEQINDWQQFSPIIPDFRLRTGIESTHEQDQQLDCAAIGSEPLLIPLQPETLQFSTAYSNRRILRRPPLRQPTSVAA